MRMKNEIRMRMSTSNTGSESVPAALLRLNQLDEFDGFVFVQVLEVLDVVDVERRLHRNIVIPCAIRSAAGNSEKLQKLLCLERYQMMI